MVMDRKAAAVEDTTEKEVVVEGVAWKGWRVVHGVAEVVVQAGSSEEQKEVVAAKGVVRMVVGVARVGGRGGIKVDALARAEKVEHSEQGRLEPH